MYDRDAFFGLCDKHETNVRGDECLFFREELVGLIEEIFKREAPIGKLHISHSGIFGTDQQIRSTHSIQTHAAKLGNSVKGLINVKPHFIIILDHLPLLASTHDEKCDY